MKKLKVLNLSKGEQFKITGGAGSCTGLVLVAKVTVHVQVGQ